MAYCLLEELTNNRSGARNGRRRMAGSRRPGVKRLAFRIVRWTADSIAHEVLRLRSRSLYVRSRRTDVGFFSPVSGWTARREGDQRVDIIGTARVDPAAIHAHS